MVGQWTYETDSEMGPGKPRAKFGGTETVRTIGGLWIVGESRGEMPGGGTALMQITLGYDPQKKRFVGTWIGSMMTNLWVYDGSLAGDVLTLNAEGPSFADETKITKYQDIIEIKSDDHRVLRSQFQQDDGTWHEFMIANYRRVD
jgi:hypothetical protein